MSNYKRRLYPQSLRAISEDLFRALHEQDDNLDSLFNSGLSFGDNFDSTYVSYVANAAPNTQDAVAHNLGRVPVGFLVVGKDRAADVYTSIAADKLNLYIKCTVASAVLKLLVF